MSCRPPATRSSTCANRCGLGTSSPSNMCFGVGVLLGMLLGQPGRVSAQAGAWSTVSCIRPNAQKMRWPWVLDCMVLGQLQASTCESRCMPGTWFNQLCMDWLGVRGSVVLGQLHQGRAHAQAGACLALGSFDIGLGVRGSVVLGQLHQGRVPAQAGACRAQHLWTASVMGVPKVLVLGQLHPGQVTA